SMSLAGFVARAGFVWLFIGDAATTLLCAIVLGSTVRDTRPSAPVPRERMRLFAPYRDRRFVALVVLCFALSLVFFQAGTSFPIDLRAHGIAPEWFGLLMALNGVLIVAVQPIFTRKLASTSPTKILAVGALLYGLGFGGFGFARSVPAYAAAVVVWT